MSLKNSHVKIINIPYYRLMFISKTVLFDKDLLYVEFIFILVKTTMGGISVPLNDELTTLDQQTVSTLNRAFSLFNCIHLITENSITSAQLHKTAHNVLFKAVVNRFTRESEALRNCRGYIFVSEDDGFVSKVVRDIHPQSGDRMVLLVNGSLDHILSNPDSFGNAEVLARNKSTSYQYDKLFMHSRHFKPVKPNTGAFFEEESTFLPDLQGQDLIISTFYCPPFSFGVPKGIGDRTVPPMDGIEMIIAQSVLDQMNASGHFREPQGDNLWGTLVNGSWHGGVKGDLAQGHVDIAFCALWVVRDETQDQDRSIPWTRTCVTFLVPRPHPTASNWRAAFSPFRVLLWMGVCVATFTTAASTCLLERWGKKLVPTMSTNRYERYSESVLAYLGVLTLSTSIDAPADSTTRHVAAWWHVFALLVTTAYSSGLVSHLTFPEYSGRVDSFRELVGRGFLWGNTYRPPMDLLFDMQNPWHVRFSERFLLETPEDPRSRRVTRGDYAVVGKLFDAGVPYFLESETLSPEVLAGFRIMKECSGTYYTALGLRRLSPLTGPVNRALYRLIESGLIRHWSDDVIMRRGSKAALGLIEEKDTWQDSKEPEKLTLGHLEGSFLLLSIGLVVSALAFVFEACKRCCRLLPSRSI